MPNLLYRNQIQRTLTQPELDENFRLLDNYKLSFATGVGVTLPIGTSGQRSNNVGALRLNNETNVIEGCYNNNQWMAFGVTGDAGPGGIGQTGSIGVVGITGPTGLRGPSGPSGINGNMGSVGATGPTGPVGNTGLTGNTGSVGSVGSVGATGSVGSAGATQGINANASPRLGTTYYASTSWVELNLGTYRANSNPRMPNPGCIISGKGYVASSVNNYNPNLRIHRSDFNAASPQTYMLNYMYNNDNKVYFSTNINNLYESCGWVPKDATVSVVFNASSDYRLKTNICKIENILSLLKQTHIYDFNYKSHDHKKTGFIAHELQEYFPFSVSGKKDEVDENNEPIYQKINYMSLIPILIASINELSKKTLEIKQWLT